MKKILAVIAAASLLFAATPASAQILGKILGGSSSSSSSPSSSSSSQQSSSSSSGASVAGNILSGILNSATSSSSSQQQEQQSQSQSGSSIAGSVLGGILGGSTGSDILGGVLNSVAGTVFSAPISLNGTYVYNGLAMSTASSDGNLLSNLAGSAISSGIESKVNGIIEKIGIKPGGMTFTFNSDNTFTCSVMGIPIGGTYKIGDSEKTVTLTFGKLMQFFSMTGTLESGLTEAKMLFPANKMTTFFKKIASVVGKSNSTVGSLSSIMGGNNSTLKLGFKLAKQ